jgi:ribonuclease HII
VCAAAVILEDEADTPRLLKGVRDSKLMSPASRESWAPRIRAAALAFGVGFASAQEIDKLGIVPATKLAALRALELLAVDALITDFLLFRDLEVPQIALVRGDQCVLSVAAASVLAKTARDARMLELGQSHPGYGFAKHKGYGTGLHAQALARLGLCEEHRCSFSIPGRRGHGGPSGTS